MRKLKGVWISAMLVAAALALAGCAADGVQSVSKGQATRPARTAEAIAIFKDVCATTVARHFAGAEKRMETNKVSLPSPVGTSTLYSTELDLSMKIVDGPGFGKSCSLVFAAAETPAMVRATFEANFSKLSPSMFGLTGIDAATRHLVIYQDAGLNRGRHYYHFTYFSDGG